MIQIEKMNKVFHLKSGDVTALDNVTLNIGDGMIYGVIGYSGAGKSTYLRSLNRLEKSTSGKIWIDDRLIEDRVNGHNQIKICLLYTSPSPRDA